MITLAGSKTKAAVREMERLSFDTLKQTNDIGKGCLVSASPSLETDLEQADLDSGTNTQTDFLDRIEAYQSFLREAQTASPDHRDELATNRLQTLFRAMDQAAKVILPLM